jgi:uncharacterized repeat protein (TIGR01451 family)
MMKLFDQAKKFLRRLPKTTAITLTAVTMLTGLGIPALISLNQLKPNHASAEFYPNRTPFDYNKPCNPNDSDIYDRCGSLTGPVFDSFINTPSYGDERSFLDARRSDQTAAGSFKDVLRDVDQGSKEVVIRMYVHNNANQSTNASGLGIAHNTKVRIALPTATNNVLRARGYISADNANPGLVEDTVDFTAPGNFSMQYESGSATLYNNNTFKNGVKLSDSIVNGGAPIGSDALDGNFKGCFEFEAVVQIKVRIITAPAPNVTFTKQTAMPGAAAWGEESDAHPGDTVKWLIHFKNSGAANLDHVDINDSLPNHLRVVPGSVHYLDGTQDKVLSDNQLFTTGGFDFATWTPGGGFFLRFDTVAKDDFDGCQVRLRNIAFNTTTQTGKTQDTADVVITKQNCNQVTPAFSCDLLELTKLGGREVQAKVNFTATNGATFKDVNFDFGDNQSLLTTNTTVNHTFANDGNFVVRATVRFNVNGQVESDTGDACAKPISFTTPPTTPVTPASTPTTLVNTGPGDVAGVFFGTSLFGAAIHSLRSRRSRR